MLTTSCSYHEINDLEIVSGIAINYINNNYELAYEIAKDNKSYTISTIGKSIDEIFTKLNTGPSKIDLSHINILIISPSMINKLNNIYNYFIENNITTNFYTVLNNNPDNILKYKDNNNLINSITIKKLLINNKISIDNQFDYLIDNINNKRNAYIYKVLISDRLYLESKVKL